jgi:hypothetical protein
VAFLGQQDQGAVVHREHQRLHVETLVSQAEWTTEEMELAALTVPHRLSSGCIQGDWEMADVCPRRYNSNS